MKSMVMKAWHEHYALLAINCMNLESAHTAVRVVEKNRAPVILSLYQRHLAYFPAPVVTTVVKALAESVSVPVTLALDRSKNPDCTRRAFRVGFNELMIDASTFPLGGNVYQAKAVMELAASAQPYVKGELGHLADTPRYDQVANADLMAQPTDMEPFVAQADIDLLAIPVDTTHGMYAPSVVPAIDFQHLARTFHCSNVSPALHSGSGTPFSQFQLCTTLGVAKINVRAAIFERGKSVFLRTPYHDISTGLVDTLKVMELAFEEAITPYLQASDIIGKA